MDPSFYHKFYSEEIPSFPVKASCSKHEKFKKQSYINALSYIMRSTDTFHDFPVTVNVFYSNQAGRQHIYFSNRHQFICLYNHSDFF